MTGTYFITIEEREDDFSGGGIMRLDDMKIIIISFCYANSNNYAITKRFEPYTLVSQTLQRANS